MHSRGRVGVYNRVREREERSVFGMVVKKRKRPELNMKRDFSTA